MKDRGMLQIIQDEVLKTRDVMQLISDDTNLLKKAEAIVDQCVLTLRSGGKILLAGNGGSAADAQHLAAELVSRLCYDRPALAAIALTTDTSALTAISNDYSYEQVFVRQLQALGRAGDVFIGISTSGKSPNVIKALDEARKLGLATVGFTGQTAPLMAERCDHLLTIPSTSTPNIQEGHITLGHIIFALIEEEIFGEQYNPARIKHAATTVR